MAKAAKSIERYYPFFAKEKVHKVLDYGAGTLRNSCFLAERGFSVYAADVPEQVERICRMSCKDCLAGIYRADELEHGILAVDLVISTYVLNIIPEGAGKNRYLQNVALNLRPGGYLLIEASCHRDDDQHEGCSWHLKCEKCMKSFSREELDRLVEPYGFSRVCHYYRRNALAVIYRLSGHEGRS